MNLRTLRSLFVLLAAAWCAACSTHDGSYYYLPSPAVATIGPPATPDTRVLATVTGLRRPSDGMPAQIETRLRVENLGEHPLTLRPGDQVLISSQLIEFRPAGGDTDIEMTVQPGSVGEIASAFPFPEGSSYTSYDLTGITLRVTVNRQRGATPLTFAFERAYYPVYGPYPYGPYWGPWGYDPWHRRYYYGYW